MAYKLFQWPASVYPGEADDCADVRPEIDVALRAIMRFGPQREEYSAKNLGKRKDGLWQLSFKANRNQYRLLYAPYGRNVVVYRIHPKTSPQEQERAYELAMKRKREAERIMKERGGECDGLAPITLH